MTESLPTNVYSSKHLLWNRLRNVTDIQEDL